MHRLVFSNYIYDAEGNYVGKFEQFMYSVCPEDFNNGQGDVTGEAAEALLDTDCESFNFKKTSLANWQEAGLNKISLRMVWVGGGNGISGRYVEVNHLVYGLPTYYTNSITGIITNLSTGSAANIAAQATEYARNMTYSNFRNSPTYPTEAAIIAYFKSKVNEYMTGYMGTAGVNGSGSSSIVFRDEERSHFTDPNDC